MKDRPCYCHACRGLKNDHTCPKCKGTGEVTQHETITQIIEGQRFEMSGTFLRVCLACKGTGEVRPAGEIMSTADEIQSAHLGERSLAGPRMSFEDEVRTFLKAISDKVQAIDRYIRMKRTPTGETIDAKEWEQYKAYERAWKTGILEINNGKQLIDAGEEGRGY